MHAVILAGGAGTRLRPLTYARRKELVPVLGRPLLEYRLRNLREHGVEDIVLACSQGMREVEEHFGDGATLGIRIEYVYEDRPLGSGRAVKQAARAAGTAGTLVVCNGDILTNLDVTGMIERHRATGATLSISLAAVDDPWHYGVVEVDDDLRIRRFIEKPPPGNEPSNLINAGTWLFEPAVLEQVPDDETAVLDGFSERVLFPDIIAAERRVQGFLEDLWVDVGSPERYLRANQLMLARVCGELGKDVIVVEGAKVAADAQVSGRVYIGRGASISARSSITGPTVIGDETIVGAGAEITASVVWEEVRIGEGAAVSGSIIGAYAGVGDRASVIDAVLGNGAEVDEGCRVEPGARVMPNERVAASG